MHDRDALPQPQFVAPVLEAKADTEATKQLAKGSKSPIKAIPITAKAPSVAAAKQQPTVAADPTSQSAIPAEPAKEWVFWYLPFGDVIPQGLMVMGSMLVAQLSHQQHARATQWPDGPLKSCPICPK